MKIVAVIPSRYGSSRFPGKPLATIAGKPMIRHVYERAKGCRELTDVYVATDDQRIIRCVEEFGGKAIMTQGVHPSGTDRVREAASVLGLEEGDLVVNIQGDQPAFNSSSISLLLEPLLKDGTISMSTLMFHLENESHALDPNNVKVISDRDGFAIYFSRSPVPYYRDAVNRKVYYKHLGFYAFRMQFLSLFSALPQGVLEQAEKLEQLRALEYGYRIKVIESRWDSPEVDVPSDIKKIEHLILP
ncbi:MAG: 3-deoxy-manno-octulosonate cytidylyltransferase [Desulfobacteraceae bacterium]|jgi:3-deoxy-manno-octulosonate cytidylyltransferase (CMP-KDO synthetase)|nr:MAG: 3-deoxy-manno-octulosonate cytidylyltransferase [Desulfobacteraceae bacterium]